MTKTIRLTTAQALFGHGNVAGIGEALFQNGDQKSQGRLHGLGKACVKCADRAPETE
jgi:TPP-dependent trihydroxycyclohexane-1,2-dione (THcHDO) dehydratase